MQNLDRQQIDAARSLQPSGCNTARSRVVNPRRLSVDVIVPIRTRYDQWTQFETFPQFMEGVESVTQVSDARSHWKVKVGGAPREFATEISEKHPEERIAWTTGGGDLKQAGVVTSTNSTTPRRG